MLKIGITGTIASGKTIISKIFNFFDIPVYNSDERAKELMTSNTEIINSLKEIFGEGIYINKQINKQLLSDFIYKSEENRLLINSIVHPKVLEDFNDYCNKINSEIVCVESALLFEANLDKILDKIIFVETPIELQIKYLYKRSNIEKDKALKIIDLQKKQFLDRKSSSAVEIKIINDNRQSLIEQILPIIYISKNNL